MHKMLYSCLCSLWLLQFLPRPACGFVTVYPGPEGSPASADYSAIVSGQVAFVYFTSRAGMQPVASGDNVPVMNGRNTSFFGFATNESVSVVVTVGNASSDPTSAQLYPLRAAAILPSPVISGRTITLTLDGPRQVCVVINGLTDAPLCIFADPLETWVPTPETPGVIYFGPGTIDAGVIQVTAGETVYLSPGAHVFGRIELTGDANECCAAGQGVAVRGRGVLDGHNFVINATGPPLIMLPCCGALLEGITMLNSPKYHLDGGYPYTTVNWTKAIAWGYSTYGFTGGSQSLIETSFLKVNDDSLKPFGTGTLVTGVIVWQLENGCAVMGSWNLNDDVGYITVRSLDVIRHERNYFGYYPDALLCFMHGGSGNLTNYLFDDIRVDMPGWAAVQIFVVDNPWAHPVDNIFGSIGAAVIIRNFSSSGPFLTEAPVQLQGYGPESTVSGVTLDAVSFDGSGATMADVVITGNPLYSSAPTLCSGCTEPTVGADWTPTQKCSMSTSYCRK